MRDVVFHYCGKMRLVDDCEHFVGALDGIRDEARVLNDENLVLLPWSTHIPVSTRSEAPTCGSDTTAA